MDNVVKIGDQEFFKVPAYIFKNGLPSCFTEYGVYCYFCNNIGKICTKCHDEEKRNIFVLKPFTKERMD